MVRHCFKPRQSSAGKAEWHAVFAKSSDQGNDASMRKKLLILLLGLILPLTAIAQTDVDHLCTVAARIAAQESSYPHNQLSLLITDLAELCGAPSASMEEMPDPPFSVNFPSPFASWMIPYCADGEGGPFAVTCMNAVPLGCMWYCMDDGAMELRPR